MISFNASIIPSRISVESISDNMSDEIFLLLKDVQENILDKHFDCDRYVAQMISLDFLEVFDIDMTEAFAPEDCEEYTLPIVIMSHLNELSSNSHILKILEWEDQLVELIDPLIDCYLPNINIARHTGISDVK